MLIGPCIGVCFVEPARGLHCAVDESDAVELANACEAQVSAFGAPFGGQKPYKINQKSKNKNDEIVGQILKGIVNRL